LPAADGIDAVCSAPGCGKLRSTLSKGGHISHTYTDHVSTLKFVEANWGLAPITKRSRDNLPNPLVADNPYVPVNSPALGDMMDMFDFDK
jgi:phospholipase C